MGGLLIVGVDGLDHVDGEFDGGDHGAGVGFVFADDIECGAVVDGGSDEGEAEGDVDGFVEFEEFDGDEPLVVIHSDDEVVFALECVDEDGVAGEGAVDIAALFACHGDGGGDDAFFFAAEHAVFGGVGVEAADGDFWFFDTEFEAGLVAEVDGVEDFANGEDIADAEKWDVDGGECDAEFFADEHHDGAFGVGAVLEEFGVAGVFFLAGHDP